MNPAPPRPEVQNAVMCQKNTRQINFFIAFYICIFFVTILNCLRLVFSKLLSLCSHEKKKQKCEKNFFEDVSTTDIFQNYNAIFKDLDPDPAI
jgi:hypothetical protein